MRPLQTVVKVINSEIILFHVMESTCQCGPQKTAFTESLFLQGMDRHQLKANKNRFQWHWSKPAKKNIMTAKRQVTTTGDMADMR